MPSTWTLAAKQNTGKRNKVNKEERNEERKTADKERQTKRFQIFAHLLEKIRGGDDQSNLKDGERRTNEPENFPVSSVSLLSLSAFLLRNITVNNRSAHMT